MSRPVITQFWDHIWTQERRNIYAYEQVKFEAVMEIIPSDVRSIIDVGCGSGNFTNRLVQNFRVIGVDPCERGLKSLQCDSRIGVITKIPCADREFDLALAMEVLEHLEYDGSLEGAVKELARTADKYVIVTTPANDDPIYYAARCNVCGSQFHLSQHVRFLGREDFPNLIPGFDLIKLIETGERIRGSRILAQLAMAGSQYNGFASAGMVCLVCRSNIKRVRISDSLWSLSIVGLDRIIITVKKALGLRVSHNYVALYERKEE